MRHHMGRRQIALALAALGLGWLGGPARAARDPKPKDAIARTEILVYEDPDSPPCQVFRRDIVPVYQASSRSRRVPLRFIDITSMPSDTPGLTGPIEIVPTAVVMRDGEEIARIVGYWGPDAFGRMVNQSLGDIE